MKLSIPHIVALIVSLAPFGAFAIDAQTLGHKAPVLKADSEESEITLTLSDVDIKRARVLVQQQNGLLARELNYLPADKIFSVKIPLNGLAELAYSFQIETNQGIVFESRLFEIRRQFSADFESSIVSKAKHAETLNAEVVQIENSLQGLRVADPKVLARQKNVELAKALVLLSKRERAVEEAERALRSGIKPRS